MTKRLRIRLSIAMTLCLLGLATQASAASAEPVWRFSSLSNTTVQPGGTITYIVSLVNEGDTQSDGSPVEVTIALPTGLTGVSTDSPLNCPGVAGSTTITCTIEGTIFAHGSRRLKLTASLDPGATGVLTAGFEVNGGGAASASTVDPVLVSDDPPGFGIDAFDGLAADAAGNPFTQAGGHPASLTTSFDLNTATNQDSLIGDGDPVEDVKDIDVDLPPGLVGDPTSTDRCTIRDLAESESAAAMPLCSPTSQIGTVLVRQSGGSTTMVGPVPLFNLVPPSDAPARMGFNLLGTTVLLDASVRSGGDYGLTVSARNTPQVLAIVGSTVTVWGVPSDSSHDSQRACPGKFAPYTGGPTCTNDSLPRAFLRSPTSCSGPGTGLPATLSVKSWQHPENVQSKTIFSHLLPGYPYAEQDWGHRIGTTGCDKVPFDPRLENQPLVGSRAGTPAAFTFDLTIPQSDDPIIPAAQSDLRKAVVTLPEGVRVNPSSADGLGACSSEQIALDSDAMPTCPDASRIGDLTIDTPLLDQQVKGGIYLAKPFDNPFDSLVAVYLVASAQGVVIKLPGEVSLDPSTGRITSTFDDNPQLPFERLHLEFNSGARAPLTAPNKCGTFTTHAVLTGWNGKTVSQDPEFTINDGCDGGGFNPHLEAGAKRNIAGETSPFILRLTRDDTDQELSTITAKLPPGLSGYLKGVPYGSQVGTVVAGAGAGSNPFYITEGKAFLEGPYKGAPLSMLFSVPAKAGPFDLGTVDVRAALRIDSTTGQITTVADPLPTILQGIPLDVRDVRVNIDRDAFTVNPTNCEPMSVDTTVTSTQGMTATPSTPFQVGDCAALAFKPKLGLKLFGEPQRGAHPKLRAVLRFPKAGGANLAGASVALPHSEFLDQAHIRTICTRVQFGADTCPAGSVYGHVKVWSPLLGYPLSGPVYLRSSNNPLPDMVLALRGPDYQPIEIEAAGRIDSVNGGIRTTFESTPDLLIDKLVLTMKGGSKGLIQNSRNICTHPGRATVKFDGQNGKIHDMRPVLQSNGCSGGKREKPRAHRRGTGR